MGNNDASADQSVDLKKSARRRLVGAVALSLLAVVVLPMVMEREPKPPSQDIQVRIPNRELVPFSPQTISGVGNSEAKIESPPVIKQPAYPNEVSTPVTHEAPKVAAPTAANIAASAPVKSTDRTAVVKPSEMDHRASKVEESRASAVLAGNDNAWLIRLGAYQNAGNVRILMAKIKEMGLPVYSEKFDSPAGPRIRVFAGPFTPRDSADRAQARIRKIGVEGTVVAKP